MGWALESNFGGNRLALIGLKGFNFFKLSQSFVPCFRNRLWSRLSSHAQFIQWAILSRKHKPILSKSHVAAVELTSVNKTSRRGKEEN